MIIPAIRTVFRVAQAYSIYSTMSAPTKADHPFWINKSLFKDIISKEYPKSRIVGFSAKTASGKGENYASILYRISVKVEKEVGLVHRSFMVKVNHESGFGVEMAKMLQVFPKEIAMYKDLLPRFEQYYAAVGETVKIGPICQLAETSPREMIIMEDIGVDGFRTADRILGLDMRHIELVVEKLAIYHAASAYHFEQNGEYSDIFTYGLVNEKLSGSRDMNAHYAMLRNFLKDLKCAPVLNRIFDNNKRVIVDNTVAAVRRRDDRFNVLCHGDLWSNNVMFRYSESNEVEECIFVDFQMCYYSSPMLDLHYLIVSSLNKECRTTQMDYIVFLYHKCLERNLKRLGYKKKIPTLLELQMDFLDTGAFAVYTTLSIFPVISAPSSDDSTLDNLTNNSEDSKALKRLIYTNSKFTEALEVLIPYFERKGYLE